MYNPQRIQKIKDTHIAAYEWRNTYVPMGIWVNDKSKQQAIHYGQKDFKEQLLRRQLQILDDSWATGSDIVPVLGIKSYCVSLVPTLFGAEIIPPADAIEEIEDSGYWVKPLYDSVEEAANAPCPAISSALLDEMLTLIRYYKENLPDNVVISPLLPGPFSIAELLRSSDFYIDMVDRPEEARAFLTTCTETLIRWIQLLLRELHMDEPVRTFVTAMGMCHPGLRLGDDSIINLSPAMTKEFVLPCYRAISEAFGSDIEIHYCSLPHSLGEHIVTTVCAAEGVRGISTQFGERLHRTHYEQIRGKLSIECGYGQGIPHGVQTYGSFEKWADAIITPASQRKGMILYTETTSVDEGKRMMEFWRTIQIKQNG